MSDLKLASLLCSRLCHDLVGPIGALGNGVELLTEEDDPGMRAEALKLLQTSAGEAARRLAFFRLAFGAAITAGERMGIEQARSAAAGLYGSGRVKLDWPAGASGFEVEKTSLRLVLALVLAGAACLPRGGTLSVRCADRRAFSILAAGQNARVPEEMAAALAGTLDAERLDTHSVVGQMAYVLASGQRSAIAIEAAADAVTLRTTLH